MHEKKHFRYLKNLFYLAHLIYTRKINITLGILGIIVIVLLREKKIEWVDSLSSV